MSFLETRVFEATPFKRYGKRLLLAFTVPVTSRRTSGKVIGYALRVSWHHPRGKESMDILTYNLW